MTDPLQAILQLTAKASLFPVNSRYYGIDTTTMEAVEGKTVVYLRRRFVPPPERFALLQEHTVADGDRPDNLAAHYLGDPELWWRLCDANAAMHPEELVEAVGRKLRITLPEGIPGARNA
jgi:hypothetical protein